MADISLNEQEKEVLDRVLLDLKKGDLTSYQQLANVYSEIPVSIDEFLESDEYLGRTLNQGRMIFPYWREALRKIDGSDAVEIILTGAIGIGKSFIAQIYQTYTAYSKLLCLRDPHSFYGIARGRKILFLFFALSESLANVSSYQAMQAMMVNSPWFCNAGEQTRHTPPQVRFQNVGFSLGSPFKRGYGITGLDIFGGILDEISELSDPDDNLKSKALMVYESTLRRMESRFQQLGVVPGKLFLVSSKQGRHAFLEEYIEGVKDSPRVLIFDVPLWEVKPKRYYSGVTFTVAISSTGTPSRMVEENEDLQELMNQGFELTEIPVEHKHAFELGDIDRALVDIAGLSVIESREKKLIPNYGRVLACVDSSKKSPFKVNEILLGIEDDERIQDYFVPPNPIPLSSVSRFVHIDVGLTHDSLGMAMVHVSGSKEVERLTGTGEVEVVEGDTIDLDFAIRVRNKERSEVPLFKIREFLLYLQKIGYRIKLVTLDSFQSRDFVQLLWRHHIASEILSVDRTDEQYLNLKNVILENRFRMYDYLPLLKELRELNHDSVRRKVDHPSGGSKDLSDGVCGASFKCIEQGSTVPVGNRLLEYLKGSHEERRSKLSRGDMLVGARGLGSYFKDQGINLPE